MSLKERRSRFLCGVLELRRYFKARALFLYLSGAFENLEDFLMHLATRG